MPLVSAPTPFSEADRTNEEAWQREAASIFERLTQTPATWVQRLTGGSINRVFLCSNQHNPSNRVVLRLAPWTQAQNRQGAAAWAEILHASGTGVVPYLATAPDGDPAPCFWMAMPFVEGLDLGKALPGMTLDQQKVLARTLFERQHLAVHALEQYAQGDCGRALRPEARYPAHEGLAWGKYLVHEFSWRMRRVHRAECGERIYALMQEILAQLMNRASLTVRSEGFMYDMGDRNVMVKNGVLSGIIDQDCVFFGDRLLAPGLAWATLSATSATRGSAFVEHWQELELSQAGPNHKSRWASVQLFCAGWIASQTGSVAQNGERCTWEPELAVSLLRNALGKHST